MPGTTPLRLIVIVSASVCGALLFRDFGAERIYVATPSMEPAMPVHSRWWVDKFTPRFRAPERGEVIVFQSPVSDDKDLIKRVIGVPGDKIEIRDKTVYRNGEKLEEPYVQHTRAGVLLSGDNLTPITVPEGYLFVLGDNRDESGDSRDWKDPRTGALIYFLPIEKVQGRILGMK